jgi:hypothetical protein
VLLKIAGWDISQLGVNTSSYRQELSYKFKLIPEDYFLQ